MHLLLARERTSACCCERAAPSDFALLFARNFDGFEKTRFGFASDSRDSGTLDLVRLSTSCQLALEPIQFRLLETLLSFCTELVPRPTWLALPLPAHFPYASASRASNAAVLSLPPCPEGSQTLVHLGNPFFSLSLLYQCPAPQDIPCHRTETPARCRAHTCLCSLLGQLAPPGAIDGA